jgi:hypothetical protein
LAYLKNEIYYMKNKIKNYRLIIYMILLTNVLSSCLNEFTFNTDISKDRLNIQGQFTNDSTDQVIEVRKASNFQESSPNIGDAIPDAEVYVLENGTKRIDFKYTADGLYKTKVVGSIGKSYQMFVKYQGEEYKSTSHIMQANQKIEGARAYGVKEEIVLSTGKVGTKNTCKINITTRLNDGVKPINAFYRFFTMYQFEEEDIRFAPLRTCFVEHRSDAGKIILLKGKDFANNKVEDLRLFSVDHDFKFLYNYLMRIEQYSVDSITSQYYSNLQELVKPDRSIFDPPPGAIPSNLSASSPEKQPFGYFGVASKESFYILTNSVKLGFNGESYCRQPGTSFNNRRKECIDCRLFPLSSTTKPSFWPK